MLRLIQGFAIFATLIAATPARAGDLIVEIKGAASTRGSVLVALFATPAVFPDKPTTGVMVPAKAVPVLAIFRNLAPGVYAVSAFHDANGNGKLDKNLLGIPTEKYGFGHDAMGTMGPPTFQAASITMGPVNQTIVINLH